LLSTSVSCNTRIEEKDFSRATSSLSSTSEGCPVHLMLEAVNNKYVYIPQSVVLLVEDVEKLSSELQESDNKDNFKKVISKTILE
jgi:hypothetical protein